MIQRYIGIRPGYSQRSARRRSESRARCCRSSICCRNCGRDSETWQFSSSSYRRRLRWNPPFFTYSLQRESGYRSEEHTSELQSQSNLVCRLLLEKKKKKQLKNVHT